MSDFIVIRHGERADTGLERGRVWFDSVAPTLPYFSGHLAELVHDPMLSEAGVETSKHVAEIISSSNVRVTAIITSPAMRAVQTAGEFSKVFNTPIAIEPGLFELLDGLPWEPTRRWRTPEEFAAAGLHVDRSYEPIRSEASLWRTPKSDPNFIVPFEYMSRSIDVFNELQKRYAGAVGTVLVVAHGPTVHTAPLVFQAPLLCSPAALLSVSKPAAFFKALFDDDVIAAIPPNGFVRCERAGGGIGWSVDKTLAERASHYVITKRLMTPNGLISLHRPMNGGDVYFGHQLCIPGSGTVVFTARGSETLRVVFNSQPVTSRNTATPVYCFVIGESQGFIRRSNRGGDQSLAHCDRPGACLSNNWQTYWVSLNRESATTGTVAMGYGFPSRASTVLVARDERFLHSVQHIGFANWTRPVEVKEVIVGPPPGGLPGGGLPSGWLASEDGPMQDASHSGTVQSMGPMK